MFYIHYSDLGSKMMKLCINILMEKLPVVTSKFQISYNLSEIVFCLPLTHQCPSHAYT